MPILAHYERFPYFTAVWDYDLAITTFYDRTEEAKSSGGTAFNFLATGHLYYLGLESKVEGAIFDLASAGVNILGLTYNYWNGTSFIPVSSILNYDFTADGMEKIVVPADWASSTLALAGTEPDQRTRYYLNLYVTSTTTPPTINQIKAISYNTYTTPERINAFTQMNTDFSTSTVPTEAEILQMINRAESYIDYRVRSSWKPNYVAEEYQEFNIGGIRLNNYPIQQILSISVWNGGDWDEMTEGRENDYFFVPETGMLYFTRYFMLPARFSTVNPWGRWGLGEFTKAVKVKYIWGRDFFQDRKAGMVEDICTRLVAAEVVESLRSNYRAATNIDAVSLESRVRDWREKAEKDLDEMQGIEIY